MWEVWRGRDPSTINHWSSSSFLACWEVVGGARASFYFCLGSTTVKSGLHEADVRPLYTHSPRTPKVTYTITTQPFPSPDQKQGLPARLCCQSVPAPQKCPVLGSQKLPLWVLGLLLTQSQAEFLGIQSPWVGGIRS